MNTRDEQEQENLVPEDHADLNVKHNYSYLGGLNKPKVKRSREAANSIVITNPGQARAVNVALPDIDARAGKYPQHNSPGEFTKDIEIVDALKLDGFMNLADIFELKKFGFKEKTIPLTKKKQYKIAMQFDNLDPEAFRQMMCIGLKGKRDFDVWYIKDAETGEMITVSPHVTTGLTQFVQIVGRNKADDVISVKHCVYDKGMPVVINETKFDSNGNLRQLSHIGGKTQGAINAVERFDDGTVLWTVTTDEASGSAALRKNGEIVILNDDMTNESIMAARNLGAEGVGKDGVWDNSFSLSACLAQDHPLQRQYKESVRRQINHVIDNALIPGLTPIFVIGDES